MADLDCVPLADAIIDAWHADPSGQYDNDSADMRYRGSIRTDSDGRYRLETLMPGHYLNGATYRPAHSHVKLVVDGDVRLTTQLYFAGDPYLEGDPLWEGGPVMTLSDDCAGGTKGNFDLALD